MTSTSALGNGSAKKLPPRKLRRSAEPVSGDVGAEDRLDGREVEAAAGHVFVRPGDRDRDSALRTTDVDHAAVVAERETSLRSPVPWRC